MLGRQAAGRAAAPSGGAPSGSELQVLIQRENKELKSKAVDFRAKNRQLAERCTSPHSELKALSSLPRADESSQTHRKRQINRLEQGLHASLRCLASSSTLLPYQGGAAGAFAVDTASAPLEEPDPEVRVASAVGSLCSSGGHEWPPTDGSPLTSARFAVATQQLSGDIDTPYFLGQTAKISRGREDGVVADLLSSTLLPSSAAAADWTTQLAPRPISNSPIVSARCIVRPPPPPPPEVTVGGLGTVQESHEGMFDTTTALQLLVDGQTTPQQRQRLAQQVLQDIAELKREHDRLRVHGEALYSARGPRTSRSGAGFAPSSGPLSSRSTAAATPPSLADLAKRVPPLVGFPQAADFNLRPGSTSWTPRLDESMLSARDPRTPWEIMEAAERKMKDLMSGAEASLAAPIPKKDRSSSRGRRPSEGSASAQEAAGLSPRSPGRASSLGRGSPRGSPRGLPDVETFSALPTQRSMTGEMSRATAVVERAAKWNEDHERELTVVHRRLQRVEGELLVEKEERQHLAKLVKDALWNKDWLCSSQSRLPRAGADAAAFLGAQPQPQPMNPHVFSFAPVRGVPVVQRARSLSPAIGQGPPAGTQVIHRTLSASLSVPGSMSLSPGGLVLPGSMSLTPGGSMSLPPANSRLLPAAPNSNGSFLGSAPRRARSSPPLFAVCVPTSQAALWPQPLQPPQAARGPPFFGLTHLPLLGAPAAVAPAAACTTHVVGTAVSAAATEAASAAGGAPPTFAALPMVATPPGMLPAQLRRPPAARVSPHGPEIRMRVEEVPPRPTPSFVAGSWSWQPVLQEWQPVLQDHHAAAAVTGAASARQPRGSPRCSPPPPRPAVGAG